MIKLLLTNCKRLLIIDIFISLIYIDNDNYIYYSDY